MLGALANVAIFASYMVASSSLVNRNAVQLVSVAKLYPLYIASVASKKAALRSHP